ncbi:MAG: glycerol-3-phosphate 1-O-acyltransferase PlsY [Bacillota bacterium]|nr:glycerol-3-phosphate 1-O-acyltransferase PlsY [Bacillota bacterium]
MTLKFIIAIVIAYVLGNISPSTIMARSRGIDIKKEGSGNAGTTNALRVMGKKAGVITVLVDVFKGTVAVIIGTILVGHNPAGWCILAVFLGHVWPVLLDFKGGKGVATTFGAVLGYNPLMALIALVVVAIVVFTSKRMSVGSLVGAISFPILSIFMEPHVLPVAIIMMTIIIVKHKDNIVRLIHGEEPVMSIFDKSK